MSVFIDQKNLLICVCMNTLKEKNIYIILCYQRRNCYYKQNDKM